MQNNKLRSRTYSGRLAASAPQLRSLLRNPNNRQHSSKLSFSSVQELQNAIAEFLTNWNEKPKPFIWTATVESIQTKLARCRQTLEQIQPGCTLPRTRKRKKQLSS